MVAVKEKCTEMKSNRCLASLALFGELYNSKQNIYNVLAEFLKYIISTDGKRQFNLTEITQDLNNTFVFTIPEAVIKTALSSLRTCGVVREHNLYTVSGLENRAEIENLIKLYEETKENNDKIIQNLFMYIQEKSGKKLVDSEKGVIIDSFCSYMLDDHSVKNYAELISAFLIEHKQDVEALRKLRMIKEGVVMYSGLKYNMDPSNLGSWNTKLTIFLDTEILFSACGYNGTLFKELFEDFYSLVKEINNESQRRDKGRKIHLRYFRETQDEIENFFQKAEDIVTYDEKINPSKTAMLAIVDGVKMPSDVIIKKTMFYEKIKGYKIFSDEQVAYYNESQHNFNLEDKNLIDQICEEANVGKPAAANALKLLSHINVLRGGDSSKNLENIGHIFMTRTNLSLRTSLSKEIRKDGDIPLATTLDFMTNKFWFKLNKSFGDHNYPKSFDVLTKAQIILSSKVAHSVAKKFDELRKSKMTESQVATCIVNLRKQPKRPEEITDSEEVADALTSISEDRIEDLLREQTLVESTAKQNQKNNEQLKQELQKKEEESKRQAERLRVLEEANLTRQRKGKKWKLLIFDILLIASSIAILFFTFILSLWWGLLAVLGAIGGVYFLRNKIVSARNWIIKH